MGSSRGYQTAFGLSAFGVRVGVRVNQPDGLGRVSPYLPFGWEPAALELAGSTYSVELADGGSSGNRLYRERRRIASAADEESLLDTFESHLAIHVANMAVGRVFVHAGVVGWCGRAIVIPGRSFSGKSTLVAALVRAGATYYSDEYALFDAEGRVHPYTRPLQLREPGSRKQIKCAAETFGAVGSEPLPLGLVLATRHRAGASWRPRKISAGRGVLELLKNTVSARRAPEEALNAFESALENATCWRGVRGEAQEAAERILAQA